MGAASFEDLQLFTYELTVSISGKHNVLLIGMAAVRAGLTEGLHPVVVKPLLHTSNQTRHIHRVLYQAEWGI